MCLLSLESSGFEMQNCPPNILIQQRVRSMQYLELQEGREAPSCLYHEFLNPPRTLQIGIAAFDKVIIESWF